MCEKRKAKKGKEETALCHTPASQLEHMPGQILILCAPSPWKCKAPEHINMPLAISALALLTAGRKNYIKGRL